MKHPKFMTHLSGGVTSEGETIGYAVRQLRVAVRTRTNLIIDKARAGAYSNKPETIQVRHLSIGHAAQCG